MMTGVRPAAASDIPQLARIADATGLFPGEMVPDMIAAFLSGSGEHWLTGIDDGAVAGFCYAAPEKLTEGTWNMLAIAVDPAWQRQGVGAAITARLETVLRERGARILIVDTAGVAEFEQARAFYRKNGYDEEARIRDFWADGNDKIVFWKRLG